MLKSELTLEPASIFATEGALKPDLNKEQADIRKDLREAMRNAIKSSALGRLQIANEMSHLLSETITKEMIDSWTRNLYEFKGRMIRYHIPAEYLAAFCKVTRSFEPLMILGNRAGLFVLPGPTELQAQMQWLDEQISELKIRKEKRALFLKKMESGMTEAGGNAQGSL